MPTRVEGTWTKVAVGSASLGVRSDGGLAIWGNVQGGLAPGVVTTDRPFDVVPPHATDEIGGDDYSVCLAAFDGGLRCWGGTEGTNEEVGSPPGWQRTPLHALTACGWSACALDEPGHAWCWGASGSLATGADTTPRQQGPQLWRQLELGAGTAAGVLADGAVAYFGQRIGPPTGLLPAPEVLSDGGVWRQATAGYRKVCAVTMEGALTCWSFGGESRLDAGGVAFESVHLGPRAGYAMTSDGGLWAWGDNDHGQLGQGTRSRIPSGFVPIPGSWRSVHPAGFANSVCALAFDDGLWCWGANDVGQLGLGGVYVWPPRWVAGQ